jgi:hypothetical protein
VGVPVIIDFDMGDCVGKALFETDEAVDGEFAGAPRLFDLPPVVNKMDLGVGAFQQEISPTAHFVLGMEENSTLHCF